MKIYNKAIDEIYEFIKETVENSQGFNFQNGDCYRFYEIMVAEWPEAVPFYDPIEGHVYVFLMNRLWDSRGLRFEPLPKGIFK